MKHITIHSFKEVVDAESANPSVDFINVCTPAEYKEKHIPGVRNVPLSEIPNRYQEFADKKTVYIHCRSGNRGMQAMQKLAELGVQAELVNVEGGILAWDEAGLPTKSLTTRIPLMRQVLIAAGGMILLGFLGSLLLHPYFMYIMPAVGAGLLFAGVTGWCGMAFVLGKMPWNA